MRAAIEAWLHRQWSKRGLFAWALSPLSALYLVISRAKFKNSDSIRVGVPVVVVGNIYVGGTGKTPITIRLVQKLREAGLHPGVISRGYGRAANSVQIVKSDSPATKVGDEPLLIQLMTGSPVAVGRDRVSAALVLCKAHPEIDVLVSDDGLQHLRLARDVELAVVGARGLGNGWVMPAGPLREPPSRLDTVDAIILNGSMTALETRTPRYAATSQLGRLVHLNSGQEINIDQLSAMINEKKATVDAAAGIAMPSRFFSMLRAHDLEVKGVRLGDHYDFKVNPFRDMKADYIFITGKDAVKCKQIPEIAADKRIWIADLEMKLDEFLVRTVIERIKDVQKKEH